VDVYGGDIVNDALCETTWGKEFHSTPAEIITTFTDMIQMFQGFASLDLEEPVDFDDPD